MSYSSERVWGSRADRYDKLEGFWPNEELLVKKYFTDKSATVLDIGCGAGRTLVPLAKMGFKKVIGLDISGEMLKKAKEKLKEEKLGNVKLIKSDAARMSITDDSVNYVLNGFNSLDCVYPVRERDKALDEVARIMAPGGVIVHSFHNILTVHGRLKFWYWTPRLILEWLADLPNGGGYLADKRGAKMFATPVRSERRRFEKRDFRFLEKTWGGQKKRLSRMFTIMVMKYESPE